MGRCASRASARKPLRPDCSRVMTVGVGIPMAGHPLHRSGRAGLPHPAPALGHKRQALVGVRMTDAGPREPARHQAAHACPRYGPVLTAAQ
jgi:hypothetical protein